MSSGRVVVGREQAKGGDSQNEYIKKKKVFTAFDDRVESLQLVLHLALTESTSVKGLATSYVYAISFDCAKNILLETEKH